MMRAAARSMRSIRIPRRLARVAAHPVAVGALLFLTILAGYLLSYNVDKPTHNADWYIRYQVTCSIVERNEFFFNPYDASQRSGPGAGGHVYAQYTLGQTTAMIPLYLLGRVLAGVAHTNCDGHTADTIVLLTCKSLDLILGALLATLFFATARLLRYTRRAALALTLLLAFGASLWPDALSNEEHTMESLFLLAGAYAALRYTQAKGERRKAKEGRLWLVAMGLAAGLVFVTRVAGLIAIPLFALYLVALHASGGDGRRATGEGRVAGHDDAVTMPHRRVSGGRRFTVARRPSPVARRPLGRDLALYGVGVLPALLVNVAYNLIRWGRPLQTGPKPDQTLGYSPWLGLPNLLLSPGKGLLWYTPALLLLALAIGPFRRRFPAPTLLFAILCGGYLLFYSNVNYWHGDPAWGPRYLYATLPYLILPLGEVFGRWRGYGRPRRAVLVGVLALSFLVQFSAVTVSYWRHWHYIYGYHYDQVEDHPWGSNLNYWWSPEQSPILISLQGVADITQKYVAHAPLLDHPASQKLSDPREPGYYRVYGQAVIDLTDLDKLRYMTNWNTFTPWWLHVYPWWNLSTVIRLALALVALFLAAGGLLLAILARADRGTRAPLLARDGYEATEGHNGAAGNGHASAGGVLLAEMRVGPEQGSAAIPVGESAGERRTLAVAARPELQIAAQQDGRQTHGAASLRPLGAATLVAALLYGGIVNVAALRAPRVTPSLVSTVGMDATVRDGAWAYRVLGVASVPTFPGGVEAPVDAAHHYAVVRLRVYNHLSRPRRAWPQWFALTDLAGLRYPYMGGLNAPVSELYHLAPMGGMIPARGAVDDILVFQVRNATPDRDLALAGPGITLVRLAPP